MQNKSLSNNPSDPSDLLTADEVGRRLRLPLSTVYYLAKTKQLPAIRFGRSWRFTAANIERLRGASASPRVLVVDDDAVTRVLVSSGLEPCGCQVWEAGSVEQALQICRGQKFDVLFVDPTFDTRLIIRVETSELAGFRGMYPIRSSLHSLLG
jgi:excisionase family DNA binding protein